MGENGLPLTESTVSGCEKADCPWLEGGFCGLAGQLLMRMNVKNIKSQGLLSFERNEAGAYTHAEEDWVAENREKFINFSSGCVISSLNRAQLLEGKLPTPLILTAGDSVQYQKNADFAFDQKPQMLKVTSNDAGQVALVSPVIYSPDVRG